MMRCGEPISVNNKRSYSSLLLVLVDQNEFHNSSSTSLLFITNSNYFITSSEFNAYLM